MKHALQTGGTGLAGSAGAWLIADGGGLTVIGMAVVTGLSCTFGMLSSLSRVLDARTPGAARQMLMNGGAVWIAAFSLGVLTQASLAGAALLGLGVGLAGTKVLEVIEAGAVGVANRVSGTKPVTLEQLAEKLGEVRQDTQKAVSEQVVKGKTDDPG